MISIDMHGDHFSAESNYFSSHVDPFVTLQLRNDDGGEVTLYIRSMKDAERIVHAVQDLLNNLTRMEEDNVSR